MRWSRPPALTQALQVGGQRSKGRFAGTRLAPGAAAETGRTELPKKWTMEEVIHGHVLLGSDPKYNCWVTVDP